MIYGALDVRTYIFGSFRLLNSYFGHSLAYNEDKIQRYLHGHQGIETVVSHPYIFCFSCCCIFVYDPFVEIQFIDGNTHYRVARGIVGVFNIKSHIFKNIVLKFANIRKLFVNLQPNDSNI